LQPKAFGAAIMAKRAAKKASKKKAAKKSTRKGTKKATKKKAAKKSTRKGAKKKAAKKRRYSPSAGSEVKNEMHRAKRGTARSGPGGKGGKVKSRKQAIAIGLSKARQKGKKVPPKKKS
jgi:hypothetical protein